MGTGLAGVADDTGAEDDHDRVFNGEDLSIRDFLGEFEHVALLAHPSRTFCIH